MTITHIKFLFLLIFLIIILPITLSCQTAYYTNLEKLGYHKRDILIKKVEEAKDVQNEAKQQLQSSIELFNMVLNLNYTEIKAQSKTLQKATLTNEQKSKQVKDRIDCVENVAQTLFKDWKSEIDKHTNKALKRDSQKHLDYTKKHYDKLIDVMRKVKKQIAPVLNDFNKDILYITDNQDNRSFNLLKKKSTFIKTNLSGLMEDIETSIIQSNDFIKAMSID